MIRLGFRFGLTSAIDDHPGGGNRASTVDVQVPLARDLKDSAVEAVVAGWLDTRDLVWPRLAAPTWFGPDDGDTAALQGQLGTFGERLEQCDSLGWGDCARGRTRLSEQIMMQSPEVGDNWPEQEANFPGAESLDFPVETINYLLSRRRPGMVRSNLLGQTGDGVPQFAERARDSRIINGRLLGGFRGRDIAMGLN